MRQLKAPLYFATMTPGRVFRGSDPTTGCVSAVFSRFHLLKLLQAAFLTQPRLAEPSRMTLQAEARIFRMALFNLLLVNATTDRVTLGFSQFF